jgi:hypothetical protein
MQVNGKIPRLFLLAPVRHAAIAGETLYNISIFENTNILIYQEKTLII